MSPLSGGWRATLALIVTACIWGSTFVIVKSALADVSVFLFLGVRFTLASFVLALMLHGRLGRARRRDWRGGAVCAGFLFLGYVLQTAGLRLTTASKSAFLTGLGIVLVPLFASLVHHSRPRGAEIIGALLATAGTALLVGGGLEMRFNFGDLLTLACAAAFAAHMLAVAHYSRRSDYAVLSLAQVAGVALFSLAGAALFEPPRWVWSATLVVAVLVTAVFATAVCFLLYTWAQRQTSAARAALILALEPVFAGVTAYFASGERWTAAGCAGAGLILGAIAIVELKPSLGSAHQ